VTPFGNAAANGDTAAVSDAVANGNMAAVSDAAAVGDVASFDVTYEMHAFHPRQYICMLRVVKQTRRGETR